MTSRRWSLVAPWALLLTLPLGGLRFDPAAAQGQDPLTPLEPFRGVTETGMPQQGLFRRQATGLVQQPMRQAALAFLATLSPEQRRITQFPLDSDVRRRWTNIAVAANPRFGISYAAMSTQQRQRADALLKAFLSTEGYRQSKEIMLINGYLAEATGNWDRYGSEKFWITIYGDPSGSHPWAWRLEGHHLVLSFTVIGDQVVMTPTFMGAEPTTIPSGPHQGVRVMAAQEAAGRALIQSLSPEQNAQAQLSPLKDGSNMLTEAGRDNAVVAARGIQARNLTSQQRDLLMAIVQSYADQFRKELSIQRIQEVRAHLETTRFSWIGKDGVEAPIYYRIQSPVVLIEFDQQRAVSLPGDPNTPLKTHIHTIVRTPNGNDYGADLLQQHLRDHHGHGPESAVIRSEGCRSGAAGAPAPGSTPQRRCGAAH